MGFGCILGGVEPTWEKSAWCVPLAFQHPGANITGIFFGDQSVQVSQKRETNVGTSDNVGNPVHRAQDTTASSEVR